MSIPSLALLHDELAFKERREVRATAVVVFIKIGDDRMAALS